MNLLTIPGPSLNLIQLLSGTGLAVLIAVISYLTRSLTAGGAWMLVVTGTIVFGFGGISFGLPIVFFFVSSTFLSRLKSSRKAQALEAFDKTGSRDYKQVLANGGIGAVSTVLYIITGWTGWYLVYLAAMGEACADTWATEIGTLSRQQPRHILNWQIVEPGRSGGITLLGTTAALAGSILTVMTGYLAVKISSQPEISFLAMTMSFSSGFLGSIIDSISGATWQAQFRNCYTGKITEKRFTRGQKNTLISGLSFVDNDTVNFSSSFMAGVFMLFFICLFL